MATVEKYQTRSGASLYACATVSPAAGRRGSGASDEAGRRGVGQRVEVRKTLGTYVAPSLGRTTVGALADEWLARKQQACAPSHYRMLESAWRTHVEPVWGRASIASIDAGAVEAWVAAMGSAGAGATTTLRACGVLSGILAMAVKSRLLAVNPCRGVENLPRKTARRHIYLSADDVARLADEAGAHRALVLVLAYCGLRWGEAVALRVGDVEFLRRRLNVSENAVQLGVDHQSGRPKAARPVRCRYRRSCWTSCRRSAPARMQATCVPHGTAYLPRPKSDGGWFAGP